MKIKQGEIRNFNIRLKTEEKVEVANNQPTNHKKIEAKTNSRSNLLKQQKFCLKTFFPILLNNFWPQKERKTIGGQIIKNNNKETN